VGAIAEAERGAELQPVRARARHRSEHGDPASRSSIGDRHGRRRGTHRVSDDAVRRPAVGHNHRERVRELRQRRRAGSVPARPGRAVAGRVEGDNAVAALEAWLSASLAARGRDAIENVRFAFESSVHLGRYADAMDIAIGLASLWRNAVSYGEGLRWIEKLRQCPLDPRDRLWLNIVAADIGLGSGDPRLMASAAAAAADLAAQVDDPPAAVIVLIY